MKWTPSIADKVIVNGKGDLFMSYEKRCFIGQVCRVKGKTKGGLYLVTDSQGMSGTFSKFNLGPAGEGDITQ